jgi:GNAT superfamily N-acetyltransferase
MVIIREYNTKKDRQAVIELVGELQDSEKTFDPRIPTGAEVKEPYFKWMVARCRKYSGQIFVAEDNGKAVGFAAVFGRVKYPTPDDSYDYAFISDLVVREPYRGKGLGHMLLSRAEEYARELGISRLQLEVTYDNNKARKLYSSFGFENDSMRLEKKLQ